jgi:endoglycosylceramidase
VAVAPRRLIAPLVAACLLAGGCLGGTAGSGTARPPPPSTTAAPDTAPLVTTDGTGFVDRAGNTVILRGADVHTLDPRVYSWADDLGMNFIRVTVPWSDYEPVPPVHGQHTWNEHRLAELDQLVAYCADNDIQVLLDFHQYGWSPYFSDLQRGGRANGIPRWLYVGRRFPATVAGLDAAEERFYTDRRATALYGDFAAMIAHRYRTSPNVLGYEVLNEPATGGLGSSQLATQRVVRWESRILAAIRVVDAERTVVFMLPGLTINPLADDLSPFASLQHLALDVHDYFAGTIATARLGYPTTLQGGAYRGTPDGQAAYLAGPLAAARNWNIPVIVGEWGAFNDEPGLAAYQEQMVKLFESQGVSWARWSLDNEQRLGLLTSDLTPKPAARQLARLTAAPAASGG